MAEDVEYRSSNRVWAALGATVCTFDCNKLATNLVGHVTMMTACLACGCSVLWRTGNSRPISHAGSRNTLAASRRSDMVGRWGWREIRVLGRYEEENHTRMKEEREGSGCLSSEVRTVIWYWGSMSWSLTWFCVALVGGDKERAKTSHRFLVMV